ncbi:MAG: hypothetical protein ACXWE1_00085 [Thermoanaerobaculia bacterium]
MNPRKSLSVVVLFCLLTLPVLAFAKPGSDGRGELRTAMRKLWEDHVTWTRLYIVAATADLPERDAAAKRLLQNQTDIGNAIKPFYGAAAGDKLTALLKDHILIAVDIIDAAKKGETARKDDAAKRWNANADDIAIFLSGANPKSWPAADMKKMMREHLETTTTELVSHLQKDWAADVAAYDKVHDVILHMADMLAAGIADQFPEKFKS